jgi:NAD(P)-dependent dehydrogenase (short-subunit alcohol dehydrogenase family)
MTGDEFPAGVALVTGAAGGMGSPCARLMAEAGWPDLLLCDLDRARLETVAAPLRETGTRVELLCADVTDPGFGEALMGALGGRPIAALIHTAGVSPSHTPDPDVVFEVNLDATMRLVETARPRMARGSAAVLFASNAGHMPVAPEAAEAFEQPIPAEGSASLRHHAADSIAAYLLGKRAIIATVKREARRWYRDHGARLVSVSPGTIDTAMMQGVENDLTRAMFANAAISRLGRPEEVAAVCVFLCSPAASFITGTDLLVDGGQTAGLGF